MSQAVLTEEAQEWMFNVWCVSWSQPSTCREGKLSLTLKYMRYKEYPGMMFMCFFCLPICILSVIFLHLRSHITHYIQCPVNYYFFHFQIIGNGLMTSSGRLMNNTALCERNVKEKPLSLCTMLMVLLLSSYRTNPPTQIKEILSGFGRVESLISSPHLLLVVWPFRCVSISSTQLSNLQIYFNYSRWLSFHLENVYSL